MELTLKTLKNSYSIQMYDKIVENQHSFQSNLNKGLYFFAMQTEESQKRIKNIVLKIWLKNLQF